MSILEGVRIIEIAALGPGPFCGMLLADLGADVIAVERKAATASQTRAEEVVQRGKRSIAINLKNPASIDIVLRLLDKADALIEGMRPGVMERLGLGPAVCLARRPSLIYGRVTGWGQEGPLSHAPGHDSNYTALSGALWYASPPGMAPVAPPTLVGDVAGGSLYLAVGILAGILRARQTGRGQVLDAAMVDGTAHMMNLLLGALASQGSTHARGTSFVDGSHWSNTYRCSDGHWINIASLEPDFYKVLIARIGLANDPRFIAQMEASAWPAQREALESVFATRSRAEWSEMLEGTDACFAPVNDPGEAAVHPHMVARGVYADVDGVLQAAPAPRFSDSPPPDWQRGVPRLGQDTASILREIGLSQNEVNALDASGVISGTRST